MALLLDWGLRAGTPAASHGAHQQRSLHDERRNRTTASARAIERAGVAMLMNVDSGAFTSDVRCCRCSFRTIRTSIPDAPGLAEGGAACGPATGRPDFISENCYAVIAGSAHLSRDPELIGRLWRPTYRAWFPKAKTITKPPPFAWQSNGSTTGNRRPTQSSGSCRPSRRSSQAGRSRPR